MEHLTAWIFAELRSENAVFGLPRELFYSPDPIPALGLELYGQRLGNPFGVAAGPHSQLAPNIIFAWLCGARLIELKTVQTCDQITVSKPCIDMADVGYNVEWSQELSVDQACDEYLRAWVLIHALHRKLDLPGEGPEIIFNLSVGYDLAGISKPNLRSFLSRMADAGELRDRYVDLVARHCPEINEIPVPSQVANSVTLSTMHGCPPDEIGKICAHLITEWGLHTSVKLNPTLLGPDRLRQILHQDLGYHQVTVPDEAFAHDIGFTEAVDLVGQLQDLARQHGVDFGVKLSNTLEVENHRQVFAADEKTMYLSGRPLLGLTVNLAHLLAKEFAGELVISYAGGADAESVGDLLAAGMTTITSCSDLLRPGGYMRLGQYMQNAGAAMTSIGATSIADFIAKTAAARGFQNQRPWALANLGHFAAAVLSDPTRKQDYVDRTATKTTRQLKHFDCIEAPCSDQCPIDQRVPEYMRAVAEGACPAAVAVTREDNPLPTILGRACNHPCENTCLRTHYEQPLAIREIKRYIMANQDPATPASQPRRAAEKAIRVAIVGAGPCGLAAAYFLARAGCGVTIFEAAQGPGGMVRATIPGYRTQPASVDQDLEIIGQLGVEFRLGVNITELGPLWEQGYDFIVVAAGAQQGLMMGIPGEEGPGVFDGLDFLRAVGQDRPPTIGSTVGVIGGGDVALDCARTARRLGADRVEIIYRRTIAEMPAHPEELAALGEEGIPVTQLVAPQQVQNVDGRLSALRCVRNQLGDEDQSGRRRPLAIPGSEFLIPLDTLIVAIGQQVDPEFLPNETIARNARGFIKADPVTRKTSCPRVYAGGDIIEGGPATIVKACGDGKAIARSILAGANERADRALLARAQVVELLAQRARCQPRVEVPQLPAEDRGDFSEVVLTLSAEQARNEASRCLACDLMCSTCVTVCPNRAIVMYESKPLRFPLPRLVVAGGSVEIVQDAGAEGTGAVGTGAVGAGFAVTQQLQVAVLSDFCNECGNCATFCPTQGRPYRDKPRLFFDRAEFTAQSDNAFMILNPTQGLEARFDGQLHRLEVLAGAAGKRLRYSSPQVELELDASSFSLIEAEASKNCREGETLGLAECATMYCLLRGVGDRAFIFNP